MEEHSLRTLDAEMARLADGDRSACAQVFTLLWPVLVEFADKTLGHGGDADDVAQRALEKIFEQASDYDTGRPAIAWALAIAAWECRTILRQRYRRREDALSRAHEDGLASSAPDPEQQAVQRGLVEALRVTMGELEVRDQETLRTAFFAEMDGAAGGVTFRKRKERALGRLRATWRMIYGD